MIEDNIESPSTRELQLLARIADLKEAKQETSTVEWTHEFASKGLERACHTFQASRLVRDAIDLLCHANDEGEVSELVRIADDLYIRSRAVMKDALSQVLPDSDLQWIVDAMAKGLAEEAKR